MASEMPVETDPIAFCERMFAERSAEELAVIARVKRLQELYIADKALRAAIDEDPAQGGAAIAARGADFGFATERLQPLWDPELKDDVEENPERWPEVAAWRRWIADLKKHRDLMMAHGTTEAANPAFHRWRLRQIARTRSELGNGGDAITHPIVAYELSNGCSVGCWFCGISAESFRGHYPYRPDTAATWRGVLQAMKDRFGTATQTGFCYWATDPMDNPDYDKFVADHHAVTGWLPQMTTAAPLKDVALTRRVMALFDRHPCVINRFSVLTPRTLQKIHETFTPDEMLAVELVIHTKQSLVSKTRAGRMRARKQKLEEQGRDTLLSERELDVGTIACVSGFLINMPEGTVRLVAPCRPSDRWPLGYRVYAEASFETADEFGAAIDDIVAHCMPVFPATDQPIALRSDIAYAPDGDGFTLTNGVIKHRVGGFDFVPRLGALLAEGTLTSGAINGALIEDGADIFTVSAVMQDLFDLGLIEGPFELYKAQQPPRYTLAATARAANMEATA